MRENQPDRQHEDHLVIRDQHVRHVHQARGDHADRREVLAGGVIEERRGGREHGEHEAARSEGDGGRDGQQKSADRDHHGLPGSNPARREGPGWAEGRIMSKI